MNRDTSTARFGRRAFLRGAAGGAFGLALHRLSGTLACRRTDDSSAPAATTAAAASPYGDWRDVYREGWSWDRVVRGTHSNANCVSACAWNLYTKDGLVWREEQAGSYADGSAGCPDFNPRGCQKGACTSDLFARAERLRYPLMRVGERGQGRFKRITWQQALDFVSTGFVDAIEADGGHGVICELGPELGYGPNSAAPIRFFKMLGGPLTDSMAMIGDVAFGGTITLGTPHTAGSSDDWFRSEFIVLWAFNPVSTRIPDAHFLTEARYRGAQVVSIAPDYNPSSIHTDQWISPRTGTDAGFALAAVQAIIAENRHDESYIREQTDLPFLVRSDNGRYLRESDLRRGGSDEVFFAWDENAQYVVPAPGSRASSTKTLVWERSVMPALRGRMRVRLGNGHEVEVRPVFDLLVDRLDREYTPELAESLCGVSADTIRAFARHFAAAKSALILSQYGACKFYHSDLLQRAQILLASVTGNIGRTGGGWHSGAFIAMEGLAVVAMQRDLGLTDLVKLAVRSYFRDPEDNLADFSRYFVPSALWHYVHGGLDAISGDSRYGDPKLKSGPREYVEEALAKGWYPIDPKRSPRMLVAIFGNPLRHSRRGSRLREHLWPKLDTVITVDFRMSETALMSDVVLPAAGWYEKVDFKYIPSQIPYVTLGDRAVSPPGESKPEWEIFSLFAENVSRHAEARGGVRYRDYLGVERRLDGLAADFSDDGRFGPQDEDELADFILKISSTAKGSDLATLRRDGHVRCASLGIQGGTTGIYSDYSPNEPVVPMRWFAEKKQPYPTLTGRQQFYVDHRWFLALDEALPRHKQAPAAGGDYPLVLSGGHTRWSIHAMWRDHALMLQLQRGQPVVLIGGADAKARGIVDHDPVQVFNDVDSVLARAKVVPSFPRGFTTVYHAWEPYQFAGHRTHQDLAPAPLKVTQLAADYGHLGWRYAHYEPGQVDRDTRVEVKRVS